MDLIGAVLFFIIGLILTIGGFRLVSRPKFPGESRLRTLGRLIVGLFRYGFERNSSTARRLGIGFVLLLLGAIVIWISGHYLLEMLRLHASSVAPD
jgi:hypothetical protein